MKKLDPLFGFECETNERGLISIEVDCQFPQERNNCEILYKRFEYKRIRTSIEN